MKKMPHPPINKDYSHHMDFYHPPLLPMPDIPIAPHYGAYMVKRKHDVHTGVDLYAPEGAEVYAIEDGEVVCVRCFTGLEAGCPHWHTTWAVDIEGYTGTVCYGEIKPDIEINEGKFIKKGTPIGKVMTVLKKDKGKAMSMLHFALHRHGWKYLMQDQRDPEKESFYDLQVDPTMLLLQLKQKADLFLLRHEIIRGQGIGKSYADHDEKTSPYDCSVNRMKNWKI